MFDNISGEYDRLNRILSFGIDRRWRKVLVKMVAKETPNFLLDIATGTADVAIACKNIVKEKILGLDIAEKMLDVGRVKIKAKNLDSKIELKYGDSEALPLDENSCDAITCAFGVRNFENLEKGLQEMQRVLKPGGKAFVLEFSTPENKIFKWGYELYNFSILPFLGRTISKDPRAYSYLPESIREFPSGEDFLAVMKRCGFREFGRKPLSFGVCSIYWGKK